MKTFDTYTETELTAAIAAQLPGAFPYLYAHYRAALFGVIRRRVNDHDTARDLLQEVFIKIWMAARTFDGDKGRLYTWMLKITRNYITDYIRKQHLQKVIPAAYFSVDSPQVAERLPVYPRVDHLGLREIINTLGTPELAVIELAYYKGHTHPEIAQALAIPLGTVKTRTRTALSKLKKALAHERA